MSRDLPPVLTALATISSRSLKQGKVMILAHKADLLVRSPPSSSSCPPDIPASSRSTAKERLKSILTREMDRLKSSRGGSGGRIEGISKVASSGGSWFSRLFSRGITVVVEDDEDSVDEGLIWGEKGSFRWEDIGGVDIAWGVSGLGVVNIGRDGTLRDLPEGDGLDEVKEFMISL